MYLKVNFLIVLNWKNFQIKWNSNQNKIKVKLNKIISSSPSNLGTSSKTFFYDHNEGEWIIGPSLMEAREFHAAGIVTDEMTDEQLIAVTGGWSCGVLTSTEILQDGEWVQGR